MIRVQAIPTHQIFQPQMYHLTVKLQSFNSNKIKNPGRKKENSMIPVTSIVNHEKA
jgi:hypothetical protein